MGGGGGEPASREAEGDGEVAPPGGRSGHRFGRHPVHGSPAEAGKRERRGREEGFFFASKLGAFPAHCGTGSRSVGVYVAFGQPTVHDVRLLTHPPWLMGTHDALSVME